MLKTYPNIEAFYFENPERRKSGEADYGVWWTEPGKNYPKWRVSYVRNTGEIYAVQMVTDGRVELLGVVPPDDHTIYYRTLDKILEGWEEEIWRPGSLAWAQLKLSAYL